MGSRERYDETWFKERAVESLKKIDEGVWDFSDSLLLYTPSGSDTYEQLQEVDTPYFRLVTKPEREYLQSIAKSVIELLPDNFDYIDLGPGTEHKEQFFFDELKKQGKTFTYIPVDISPRYLEMAQSFAEDQDIPVKTVRSSFEELSDMLSERTVPRFVSLGLTFSNYEPNEVLPMLGKIAGHNGWSFINAQIRDRIDMNALKDVYRADAVHIADDKVRLIGLDPENDISERLVDDGFKVWCTVKNSNQLLDDIGVKQGDRLLIFQSRRYTKTQLEEIMSGFDKYQLFDTGTSFIATMIGS